MHYSNLVAYIAQNLSGLLDFLFIHVWGKVLCEAENHFQDSVFFPHRESNRLGGKRLYQLSNLTSADIFPVFILVHSPFR